MVRGVHRKLSRENIDWNMIIADPTFGLVLDPQSNVCYHLPCFVYSKQEAKETSTFFLNKQLTKDETKIIMDELYEQGEIDKGYRDAKDCAFAE